MIAQIVPVLRLRRNTNWWSYKIRINQKCSVGSLVVVDFRGSLNLGVVWKIEKEMDDIANIKEISSVLTQSSLLTVSHIRLIEWLALNGLCSLSTALYTWLPTLLRKYPLNSKASLLISGFDEFKPNSKGQTALILPGKREEQTNVLSGNTQYLDVFKDQTPFEELTTWIKTRIGEITTISGRERAIFAPWNNLKKVLIIDPEDISYFHEQIPYLNLTFAGKELANICSAEILLKSYLPLEATNEIWGIPNSSSLNWVAPKIEIASLINQKIINPTLIREVSETLASGKTVCLICSSYSSFDVLSGRGQNEPFEQTKNKIPGIETLTKNLLRELKLQYKPNNLLIGTTTVLQNIPENLHLTVFVTLDPLLSSPIFANKLSSYASIIKATQKSEKVIFQTFDPNQPILGALINNSTNEFIGDVASQQKSSSLPPFGNNLVCSYPTLDPEEVEKIRQKISKILEPTWRISYPIKASVRKKESLNLIIHSKEGERIPTDLKNLLTVLPKPWKVQNNPWYLV